jgi:hypothetical protein
MSTGASRQRTHLGWIALGLMLALLVGIIAGVLGWLSGQVVAAAILTGGVAFGGAVSLALAILKAMRD